MRIDDNTVQNIKNNIKLSDLISQYTKVKNASNNEKVASCLFHTENTPSMYINDSKGLFHCFGCGAKGDVITIIEQMEGISFKEAVEKLAEENGIDITTTTSQPQDKEDLTELLEALRNIESPEIFDNDYLKKYNSNGQHKYLLDLGFKEETLDRFEIGYCFDANDILHDRVTIPWRNSEGELVAIVGRDITDTKSDKYKSCFGSKKINHLYNLHRAKQFGDKGLILVEDEKSVMRLWEFGYYNAVALGGSELSDKKWLLRKYADTVYVCMDNCKSGDKNRRKIIPELYKIMNVYNIDLPNGYKDVAEIHDKDLWTKAWENKDKVRRKIYA